MKDDEGKQILDTKELIPYIVSLVGAIVVIVANFIKYLEISNWLYSRKVSVIQIIMESFDDPDNYLKTISDKIALGMFIVGIIIAALTLLFSLLKKTTLVIIFAIISCLPFLMMGQAWIHYIGVLITLVGAIWYKIVIGKNK